MKSIKATKVHPLTKILWEREYRPKTDFNIFVARDGLRRFDIQLPHESLKSSLRHISSTPCRTYSPDGHCGICYFGYLFDLPDETHYNCMFDETFRVIYLSVHNEETQRIKHKIAKRVLKKRRKNCPPLLELLKDEIFEWCKSHLDLELKRNKHRTYLEDLRNKFGVKNAR